MKPSIPILLVAVALAGCDPILGTDREGYLTATVVNAERVGTDSSAAGEYEGTGSYDVYLKDQDLDGVSITSEGVGDSEGDKVLFHLLLYDWPAAREYRVNITPEEATWARGQGLAAQYSITRPDGVFEAYWAVAGRLVISEIHRRYMEGSFTLTGKRCLVATPLPDRTYDGPCAGPLPIVIPDSARTTEVSGTFLVTTEEQLALPWWPKRGGSRRTAGLAPVPTRVGDGPQAPAYR